MIYYTADLHLHYAPLLAVAFAAVGLFTGVIASGLSVKRYSHER